MGSYWKQKYEEMCRVTRPKLCFSSITLAVVVFMMEERRGKRRLNNKIQKQQTLNCHFLRVRSKNQVLGAKARYCT